MNRLRLLVMSKNAEAVVKNSAVEVEEKQPEDIDLSEDITTAVFDQTGLEIPSLAS